MRLFRTYFNRIKNRPTPTIERDYVFNIFSLLVLLIVTFTGIALLISTGGGVSDFEIQGVAAGLLFGGLVISIFSVWHVLLFAIFAVWILVFTVSDSTNLLLYLIPVVALVLSSSVQLVYHWDKAVILRFGKFRRVREAGLFFLIPFVDRIAEKVDTRIRVTDFAAERTLTRDNVPVHVDALCFWLIWDAQRAILEVENYVEAVTLSAQTALRDAIGSHDLAELLSERERVGARIQQILDRKTNPWGISILSVEFTDIIIPKELEDVMSRKAQAERERQARVILGDSEVEVAKRMKQAGEIYAGDPQALQLRAMNMVFDGLRQSKGSMIMVPSSAVEQLNLGAQFGLMALNKQRAASVETETQTNKGAKNE